MGDMPAAEVDVDEALVRALLQSQHPSWADLPLVLAAFGWDNVVYRLGDDLAVRLPRRAMSAPLVEHEQFWLPRLAPRLPLAIPAPVAVGRPGCGYPWSWSVVPWLPGEVAEVSPPLDLLAAADVLGRFVDELHRFPAEGAPANPFRGVPLAARDEATRARLAGMPEALSAWASLVATPGWSGPPVLVHGDLHPANLVVQQGKLTAVIDFGDITAGDPAVDLMLGWMLFDGPSRHAFRRAEGAVDDDTWARGAGWALSWSAAVLAHSADNPLIEGIGRRTMAAVLAWSGPASIR